VYELVADEMQLASCWATADGPQCTRTRLFRCLWNRKNIRAATKAQMSWIMQSTSGGASTGVDGQRERN
jgi:hypothetical protein